MSEKNENNQTKDFLIRNMPIELYNLLGQSAKEHHRSKNQEAIVVLNNALSIVTPIAKPIPFKWKKKIPASLIRKAVKEGRE